MCLYFSELFDSHTIQILTMRSIFIKEEYTIVILHDEKERQIVYIELYITVAL